MSVAREFFSERHLTVGADTGVEYVAKLKGLLDGARTLDQECLSPAPFGDDDVCFFFRGQTNGSYGINSSLYRVIKDEIPNPSKPRDIETLMRKAEERVIRQARAQGIGRNLTPLELLTVLQHHLIPTRLIDVSASWKVALYFASEELDGTDGRMFVIATKPSMWGDFPRAKSESMLWPTSRIRPWQETTWPVLLPFTDPRMIAQQGYFLAGGLATNTGGNHQYWNDVDRHVPKANQKKSPLTQRELREVSTLMIKFPMLTGARPDPLEKLQKEHKGRWTAVGLTIPVPAELKFDIRTVLKEKYHIDKNSIYPPIDESSRLLRFVAGAHDLGIA